MKEANFLDIELCYLPRHSYLITCEQEKSKLKLRCDECRGKGFIEETETCNTCKGTGSMDLVIGVGGGRGKKCQDCKGKGKLIDRKKCDHCEDGYHVFCAVCGNQLDNDESFLCSTCEENPVIIQLAQPLDHKYLNGKRALAAKVIDVDKYVTVDIGAGFKGSFKPRSGYYNVGQLLPIRLKRPITPKDRGGRPAHVVPLKLDNFKVVKKHLPVEDMTINEINQEVGNVGRLMVQIIDIFVIRNGPTLYTFVDKTGTQIQATAYGDNNRQAYPSITRNTVVNIIGRFRYYNDQERIQIYSMERVKATQAMEFMENLASINQRDGSSLDGTSFFTESIVYDKLKDSFLLAAKRIRSAILRSQNIIIRYYSPSTDGTIGAYALDFAIRRYLANRGAKRDEFRRALRRLPHRNSMFEVEDAARDFSFALSDGGGGKNLPLYVLVNFGSSEESYSALDFCKSYGVDVIIIDHHGISDGVEEKCYTLLNPNLVEENNQVSSGMLATELANFIAAEQDISKRVIHLAAMSGIANKFEGVEMDAYMQMAEEYEFEKEKIENIRYAIDYVTFGLRFVDGAEVTRNLLGVSGPRTRTNDLIESITPAAKSKFNKSLKDITNFAEEEELENGVSCFTIDMETYAPRYDFPTSSDLLFEYHHQQISEVDNFIVTLGVNDNYLSMRHSDVSFSFPSFFEDLEKELPDLGLSGRGFTVAGSIQYYSVHKDQVVEKVKELLAKES